MQVIILVALIFVVLSLANKYLKVPKDDNQRYDGINNRFYGEGYTGDVPVPPSDDEDREGGREDLQDEPADDGTEFDDSPESGDGQEFGDSREFDDEAPEDQAGEQMHDDDGETGAEDHGTDQADQQPAESTAAQRVSQISGFSGEDGLTQAAPGGDKAVSANTGDASGVVIDTEVHLDAVMPQDIGKS